MRLRTAERLAWCLIWGTLLYLTAHVVVWGVRGLHPQEIPRSSVPGVTSAQKVP